MANVKATNMSDGTNTAYFLNALKVESDMLILYNEENQLMNSTVDLRDLRTTQSDGEETSVSGDGRQKVYYANNYITESMAMGNCTSEFNRLILGVYNNGGGVIKLNRTTDNFAVFIGFFFNLHKRKFVYIVSFFKMVSVRVL